MTKDEAVTVFVRVGTALHGLAEALKAMPEGQLSEDDMEIVESLEEALQASQTAQAALKAIIDA